MTINVKVGDEVLVTRDPLVWLRVAGPIYVDKDGAEYLPFRMRGDDPAVPPLSVLVSLVLRIRKSEEVVARELMR